MNTVSRSVLQLEDSNFKSQIDVTMVMGEVQLLTLEQNLIYSVERSETNSEWSENNPGKGQRTFEFPLELKINNIQTYPGYKAKNTQKWCFDVIGVYGPNKDNLYFFKANLFSIISKVRTIIGGDFNIKLNIYKDCQPGSVNDHP
ncbi:unnamed protein product [Lepeophtheirus salmonis]|uniref:(salmon louse) hypothetical protein n=1 Tax=Lepeophtheirus salmonis TaxID=72036 RepID=A0A7R8CEI9_LEPSM|nr:unnamed protein product [Lepeophtheirus salmonis]CAF2795983.1 unnamed protein product [Lepeophtheirus salmonis]